MFMLIEPFLNAAATVEIKVAPRNVQLDELFTCFVLQICPSCHSITDPSTLVYAVNLHSNHPFKSIP